MSLFILEMAHYSNLWQAEELYAFVLKVNKLFFVILKEVILIFSLHRILKI